MVRIVLLQFIFLISGSLSLNTGKYGPEITPYFDTSHAANQ